MLFAFEEFELDEPALELRRRGERVPIGDQSLQLLLHLVRNRQRVVSREELHEILWKGAAIGETSLGQAVRHARRALGRDTGAQRFIRNVRGRGYRFVADVDEVADAPAGARAPDPEIEPAGPQRPAFFGRAAELAAIRSSLEALGQGRGDAIWISGEEGIGKTRLLDELEELATARDAIVLRGGCSRSLWDSSYGPFAEIVAATRSLPAALPAWSDAHGDGLARISQQPAGALLDARAPGAAREEDRLRLFEATTALFSHLASRAPLLILLDDLHWADLATLALAYEVARRAPTGGWLLIGALRDGDQVTQEAPRLAALQQVGERRAPMRLEGLQQGETEQLLERLAGRPLPEGFVRDIQSETGGNPFFAREILRHLLEEGTLVDEHGEWQRELRLESVSLPVGVRQVLSRRLAALGPAARELLTVASAARGSFHFDVVRRAAQLDEVTALDGLDEALEANILTATDDAEVYGFAHDLTRRVLYSEQSPARRVRLHRRLAESLLATHGSRAGEHAERIARHYHASAELSGAEAGIPHCLVAADRAAAVAAWEDEASFLEMALELLPSGDRRRFELLERFGLALAFGGATSRAASIAAESAALVEERSGRGAAADYLVNVVTGVAWGATDLAWDLSERARRMASRDDPLTWARLRLIELWKDSARTGHPLDTPEHRQATVAALENWSALDDARKNSLALVGLAFESRAEVLERASDTAVFLALSAGEYEQAIERFRADIEASETHPELAASYFYLSTIARLQAALGRLDEARAGLEDSERRLEGLPMNAAFRSVRASVRSEIAHVEGRGFEALIPVFEELVVSVDEGSKWLMPTAMCAGAEVFALAGRSQDALRMLEAGLPGMVRSPGWMTSFTLMVNAAVGTLWALGRDDWSTLLEKQLREKTLEPDFRFPGTDARLSMARICTLQERFEEAATWFEAARNVLDEQGARPLRAITDLDETRMLFQRGEPGDRERAEALLRGAVSSFRSIGMPGWTLRAETLRAARYDSNG
jgi:DNA-binding winged helix-turn-helix (wHTH) protein/tetratricopeptide (TPR) repeat protein